MNNDESITVKLADAPQVREALSNAAATISDLEIRIQELEMDRYVPGQSVCPACKFALSTTLISATTGQMGTPIAPVVEPCPNGCGPLRPLTWHEQEARTDAALRRKFDQLNAVIEQLGQLAEGADSALFMATGPTARMIPDRTHVEGLSSTLRDIRDELAKLYTANGGNAELNLQAR